MTKRWLWWLWDVRTDEVCCFHAKLSCSKQSQHRNMQCANLNEASEPSAGGIVLRTRACTLLSTLHELSSVPSRTCSTAAQKAAANRKPAHQLHMFIPEQLSLTARPYWAAAYAVQHSVVLPVAEQLRNRRVPIRICLAKMNADSVWELEQCVPGSAARRPCPSAFPGGVAHAHPAPPHRPPAQVLQRTAHGGSPNDRRLPPWATAGRQRPAI